MVKTSKIQFYTILTSFYIFDFLLISKNLVKLEKVCLFSFFRSNKEHFSIATYREVTKKKRKYFRIPQRLIVVQPRFLAWKEVTHVSFFEKNFGARAPLKHLLELILRARGVKNMLKMGV